MRRFGEKGVANGGFELWPAQEAGDHAVRARPAAGRTPPERLVPACGALTIRGGGGAHVWLLSTLLFARLRRGPFNPCPGLLALLPVPATAFSPRAQNPRERPLKLVVTSATLDGDKFSAYFNNCPVGGAADSPAWRGLAMGRLGCRPADAALERPMGCPALYGSRQAPSGRKGCFYQRPNP